MRGTQQMIDEVAALLPELLQGVYRKIVSLRFDEEPCYDELIAKLRENKIKNPNWLRAATNEKAEAICSYPSNPISSSEAGSKRLSIAGMSRLRCDEICS
jgi:hypothetical protein